MKFTFFFTVSAAAILFSSCNTIIGVGRDMRMGGEGLEKTATKVSGGGGGGESSSEDTSGAPVY
jgi:predicted small secreted protein